MKFLLSKCNLSKLHYSSLYNRQVSKTFKRFLLYIFNSQNFVVIDLYAFDWYPKTKVLSVAFTSRFSNTDNMNEKNKKNNKWNL